jgi:hypothetical protein
VDSSKVCIFSGVVARRNLVGVARLTVKRFSRLREVALARRCCPCAGRLLLLLCSGLDFSFASAFAGIRDVALARRRCPCAGRLLLLLCSGLDFLFASAFAGIRDVALARRRCHCAGRHLLSLPPQRK